MSKFIRKVILVDAFQWNGQPAEEWPEWAGRGMQGDPLFVNGSALTLATDRGPGRVNRGDWVIRHPEGRLWMNDDKYFRENYNEEGGGASLASGSGGAIGQQASTKALEEMKRSRANEAKETALDRRLAEADEKTEVEERPEDKGPEARTQTESSDTEARKGKGK